MKILHTSDWHIGQKLHGHEREEEFQLFFKWLHQLIQEENIDALLIAGDVFDVGFPSNNALKLYYQFLTSLIGSSCKQVIITGGNHDYISTLEAPADVLAALNIRVVGGAKNNITDELIEVYKADKLECVVAAVPFLRDKDIRQVNAGESYEETQDAINNGIVGHYQELADEVKIYDCPVIAMGHLFVHGASQSESERDIHIGNLGGFNAGLFPEEFDYIALGHIHRPQKISEKIRYSGSPLPLSFSERKDNKQVIVLTIDRDAIKSIESVEVPSFRKLTAFKGSLDEVAQQLNTYAGTSELEDWAEMAIEEDEMDTSLRAKFEALLDEVNRQDNQLLIVKPSLRFTSDKQLSEYEQVSSLADLSVTDVFDNLLNSKQVVSPEGVTNTFSELMDDFFHQSENE
ncbi:exonuclease SbcCD subunit D C-terminal domain-containing protein [Carboxylicivirga sp. RSCT41]|uniref:exonuclease SbcCD subunit D C-terminal domain-containing protein n=1 Tax=Carboxylicivirga agarovorans TaxID=3417570 RepID=UPI003D33F1A9